MNDANKKEIGAILIQRLARGFIQRKRFKRLLSASENRDKTAMEVLTTERSYIHALIAAEKVQFSY